MIFSLEIKKCIVSNQCDRNDEPFISFFNKFLFDVHGGDATLATMYSGNIMISK